MNGRFQIAIHILTLLSKAGDELLSSEYIAGSMNINPALARKEISNLRNHGLISSKEGKNGGYSLGKSPGEITLFNIYVAVKPATVLGQAKNLPNPDCIIGKQINDHLFNLNKELNETLSKKLNGVTLADFSGKFN